MCFTPNTRIFCAYIVTCCNSLWFPALFLIDIMETDISSILMVSRHINNLPIQSTVTIKLPSVYY